MSSDVCFRSVQVDSSYNNERRAEVLCDCISMQARLAGRATLRDSIAGVVVERWLWRGHCSETGGKRKPQTGSGAQAISVMLQ